MDIRWRTYTVAELEIMVQRRYTTHTAWKIAAYTNTPEMVDFLALPILYTDMAEYMCAITYGCAIRNHHVLLECQPEYRADLLKAAVAGAARGGHRPLLDKLLSKTEQQLLTSLMEYLIPGSHSLARGMIKAPPDLMESAFTEAMRGNHVDIVDELWDDYMAIERNQWEKVYGNAYASGNADLVRRIREAVSGQDVSGQDVSGYYYTTISCMFGHLHFVKELVEMHGCHWRHDYIAATIPQGHVHILEYLCALPMQPYKLSSMEFQMAILACEKTHWKYIVSYYDALYPQHPVHENSYYKLDFD